jgi:hypothetical protein
MPEWSTSKSSECSLGFFGSLMDLARFAFRTTLSDLVSEAPEHYISDAFNSGRITARAFFVLSACCTSLAFAFTLNLMSGASVERGQACSLIIVNTCGEISWACPLHPLLHRNMLVARSSRFVYWRPSGSIYISVALRLFIVLHCFSWIGPCLSGRSRVCWWIDGRTVRGAFPHLEEQVAYLNRFL